LAQATEKAAARTAAPVAAPSPSALILAAGLCIYGRIRFLPSDCPMPSFDIVSEVDMHELTNAVDQASREITQRFDFKGVDATFDLKENVVMLHAQHEFQIQQMLDMLRNKLAKRKIDVQALKTDPVEQIGNRAQQKVTIQQGIETETAKKIVKHVKELKIKVQASIQGDKLRVTGNKRDDLQAVIANLRQQSFGLPLQFNNFRD
jgi:uncharacterized protein YajQ (UPF0234 family)